LGDVLQATGANAVHALLVFLNLLECQPERVGLSGLAHIEHEPPHTQAPADMLVGNISYAASGAMRLSRSWED
jgi:hypothetical protein